jgi:hypothetical protein
MTLFYPFQLRLLTRCVSVPCSLANCPCRFYFFTEYAVGDSPMRVGVLLSKN